MDEVVLKSLHVIKQVAADMQVCLERDDLKEFIDGADDKEGVKTVEHVE